MSAALQIRRRPVLGLYEISLAEANELLVEWGHYLGPVNRPFRSEAWGLDVGGRLVSVAVSSSAVNHVAADDGRRWQRAEVVELSRLCSSERWATRVMLRLWREVCAREWACPEPRRGLPPLAAVAYSQTSRHEGDIYRFDGWECLRSDAGSGGGGTWSSPRSEGAVARGKKKLWLFPLEALIHSSVVVNTDANGVAKNLP